MNEYGYCPVPSKLLSIRTLGTESGSLYSWGSHKNAELLYNEKDISSNPLWNSEKAVAFGPIKVSVFKEMATHIASSDCQTLVTINTDNVNNLVQGGVTFEQEDEDPIIIYEKEEAEKCFYALPFSVKVQDREENQEQIVKVECGMNYNVVLSSTGKVYSWGIANFGQLGQENNILNNGNSGFSSNFLLLKFFKNILIV